MKKAVLNYFLIDQHLLALVAVRHSSGEEAVLTGCAPLRSTTVPCPQTLAEEEQLTVFECTLPLLSCDRLEVYVGNQLLAGFWLQEMPVRVCPGPGQGDDVGQVQAVTWLPLLV